MGFILKNFDVFRYRVLILLKTKYKTYHISNLFYFFFNVQDLDMYSFI
jgi:hypothetical protein